VQYDTKEEFFIEYRTFRNEARIILNCGSDRSFDVCAYADYASIKVCSPQKVEIESIFEIFESRVETSKIPVSKNVNNFVVFIGHGRSSQWRELKDHLQCKHGIKVETYETGARAGHTIRDILEDISRKSNFALLVMTAEDEQADGSFRARQNVIHEIGLFQGKLGFCRAIVLMEEGVEEFSNIFGIQQFRYSKDNIKETFGEIVATIRREFYSQDFM
jgi:predicted nucleotide-binding protein